MSRPNIFRLLLLFLLITLMMSLIMVLTPLVPIPSTSESVTCSSRCALKEDGLKAETTELRHHFNEDQHHFKHRLAVIVPFRDRFDELLKFVPHIHQFLNRQQIDHQIYIMNQVDKLRFNRASLINVGFLMSRQECDYIAMHDVDLLPLNDHLSYGYPEEGPFHVSSPELHPKYHYKTFVGGILLMTNGDFEKLNGMSNRYWGWGLEDDEFYARMKAVNMGVSRPQGIKTGVNDTFLHIHDKSNRKRDMAKLFNQKEVTRRRDKETGISNVKYQLVAQRKLLIESAPCHVFDIRLECDYKLTPWCDLKLANGNGPKNKKP